MDKETEVEIISIHDLKEKINLVTNTLYFDESQFLREKTSSPIMVLEVINEIEDAVQDSKISVEDKYYLNGVMGNFLRIYGEPKRAIPYLNWCLEFATKEENLSREIVSLIRLGEALKYNNQHKKALEMFDTALYKCKGAAKDFYIDFPLQHKGKCYLELNLLNEAEDCFIKALEIRKYKGNKSLIESTQLAIELVRKIN
ncbi:tetratricopeptide repeat protein [Cytobacillus sp. IB215665]|uniref:tetratricopeptide repeat protein n=1 Tax=Cytobacillus sp. IB215665 TaxID=3097357 RepID=UPI002A16AEF5|nr:tetratricopeptide repeat protein [Cytobacillus sp. IB215665]MDX8365519.1 tetratricopeptide repeat protein [Cytobacillus sp. IB215665]